MLTMRWGDVSGMKTLDRALSKLSGKEIRQVGSRALNRAGNQGRTHAGRALAKQTGLKVRTIRKAMKPWRASPNHLEFKIKARGGDISLMHFAARETRRGVSAKPFGVRKVFPSTFMKAGWFPKRVVKPNWNGQVFLRTAGSTENGMDRFEKQRSGVFIPQEMIKGESAKAWEATVGKVLPMRVRHEIKRVTGKAFG